MPGKPDQYPSEQEVFEAMGDIVIMLPRLGPTYVCELRAVLRARLDSQPCDHLPPLRLVGVPDGTHAL